MGKVILVCGKFVVVKVIFKTIKKFIKCSDNFAR